MPSIGAMMVLFTLSTFPPENTIIFALVYPRHAVIAVESILPGYSQYMSEPKVLLILFVPSNTVLDHKEETQSPMCQNCIQDLETGKTDRKNLTSICTKLNGAQMMECF